VFSQPDDWSGTVRYEIISCLGKGGMGVVYEAFDRERRQRVALKTLLHFDASALYLFKQEFRTLADVHHTNLVRLHELVASDPGRIFFTMELVRGVDFRRYVQRPEAYRSSTAPPSITASPPIVSAREESSRWRVQEETQAGPRSPADVDRLRHALRQLVDGIHVLHSAGKLHRDIKPSNVLVTPEGRVVVLDFGVATDVGGPAGHGEVVGTARYMAPEQVDDDPPTTASDWYSVGVMLYEALVGRPPFAGSLVEMLTQKSIADPPPPSVWVKGIPADLDMLCRSLLHCDPKERPTGTEILRFFGVTRSSAPTPRAPGKANGTLLGREGQLQALGEAFERSRSGETTTVRVAGLPGMGKSTVVRHFIDGLARRCDVVVLRGRAYERESVPYKVVDSVIDALSLHLLALADQGDPVDLPEDTWALARLFPVLERVPGIDATLAASSDHPSSVRRRAFGALREIFASLARRKPVIVLVDDVHWGDADSAALLLDLLRPPIAAPLLLLLIQDEARAPSSPFLNDLRAHWPEGAQMREITVGPLITEDARRLALDLLGADDELAHRTASAVAREARGSPFLIEELVRSAHGAPQSSDQTLTEVTLEEMVGARLARLPDQARRLSEIVAVAARPLPVSVVASASEAGDEADQVIALLGTRRFVTTGLRDGREIVEMIHEPIRQAIVAQIPASTLRDHHSCLASALENAASADAEAIAMHWLGAGKNARAAHFAESAAEQAAAKLAFDQASRLFRLALANVPASSPDVLRLRPRLARVLQHSGRHGESAKEFLAAAQAVTADARLGYEQAAAQQLLSAGHIEEGAEVLQGVLAAVGMRAPRSPSAAVFWLIVYRLWLAFIGLRFRERKAEDVSPEDRLRLEALATVAVGFAIVNVILAACMQARYFVEALRVGDRLQLVRAATMAAAHLAGTGKPRRKRETALVQMGRRLAEEDGTPEAARYFEAAWGIGLFQHGRWREALVLLDRADKEGMRGIAGSAIARVYGVLALLYMGELKEMTRRANSLREIARDRGDLYTLVTLDTAAGAKASLVADDPAGALRNLRDSLAQWPKTEFFAQHWMAMIYEAEIELYVGNGHLAYQRILRDRDALRKSYLLNSVMIRVLTFFAQGRAAIASIESHPELRQKRIGEARHMARRLARAHDPWIAGLAFMMTSMAENAAGNHAAAVDALRSGVKAATATDAIVFAVPARHRLGELLGGDEGRELVQTALDAMVAQDIRNPARWLALHMPGKWGPAHADQDEGRKVGIADAQASPVPVSGR
jgi:serine/threonine protein kinase